MRTNTVTAKLRASETARGAFVNFAGVGIVPIMRPRYCDVAPLGLRVPARGCA